MIVIIFLNFCPNHSGGSGAVVMLLSQALLPCAQAFAPGAMIFVVVGEPAPESPRNGNTDLATKGALVGLAVMMILEPAAFLGGCLLGARKEGLGRMT